MFNSLYENKWWWMEKQGNDMNTYGVNYKYELKWVKTWSVSSKPKWIKSQSADVQGDKNTKNKCANLAILKSNMNILMRKRIPLQYSH